MKTVKRIFMDLDDVLNRFTMPALVHVGCPVSKYNYDKYPIECGYNIIEAANSFLWCGGEHFYNRDEFWSLFGEKFWANLPVSSEMIHFMGWAETAVGTGNVYILTSATGAEGCLEGKRKWIIEHLGFPWVGRLITCADKFVCANDSSLLIDDSYDNVDMFIKHGGRGILVPRPWNILHGKNALSHVRCVFAEMIGVTL